MTEKTLNAIEIGAVTVLSAGLDFVVDKTVTNAVHGVLHPSETQKYEMLVQENIKAIETCSEVSKVMAQYEVKVYDAVGDIYKKMVEGTING